MGNVSLNPPPRNDIREIGPYYSPGTKCPKPHARDLNNDFGLSYTPISSAFYAASLRTKISFIYDFFYLVQTSLTRALCYLSQANTIYCRGNTSPNFEPIWPMDGWLFRKPAKGPGAPFPRDEPYPRYVW